MSNQFSIKNLSAETIFQRLDAMDNSENKTDGLIQKSIWDRFAALANGRGVSIALGHDRGIISINEYLKRGNKNPEILTNICNFLNGQGDVEQQVPAQNVSKTAAAQQTTRTQQAATVNNVVSVRETEPANSTASANIPANADYQNEYNMIKQLVDLYGYNVSEENMEKFAEEVGRLCKASNTSPEAIISIICIESNFNRKPADRGSKGVMQITGITVSDILKHASVYEKLDANLYREVIYDKSGRKLTQSEILKKCYNEPEFCIKVGILCYKRKELKAICAETGLSVKTVMHNPQHYKNQMTQEQRKRVQEQTFYYYNANPAQGGSRYVARLKKHGIDAPANCQIREGYRMEATRNYELLGGNYNKVYKPDTKINPLDNENACVLRTLDENW